MTPLHRPERDHAGMPAEDAEAILHADRVSFEEARVGEHHTTKSEPITLMALLAVEGTFRG